MHDPKVRQHSSVAIACSFLCVQIVGTNLVKAQIKLAFKTADQKPVLSIRSFQVAQKKNTRQFKQLDSVLRTVNSQGKVRHVRAEIFARAFNPWSCIACRTASVAEPQVQRHGEARAAPDGRLSGRARERHLLPPGGLQLAALGLQNAQEQVRRHLCRHALHQSAGCACCSVCVLCCIRASCCLLQIIRKLRSEKAKELKSVELRTSSSFHMAAMFRVMEADLKLLEQNVETAHKLEDDLEATRTKIKAKSTRIDEINRQEAVRTIACALSLHPPPVLLQDIKSRLAKLGEKAESVEKLKKRIHVSFRCCSLFVSCSCQELETERVIMMKERDKTHDRMSHEYDGSRNRPY